MDTPYDNDKGPRKRPGAITRATYDYFSQLVSTDRDNPPLSPRLRPSKKSTKDFGRYFLLLIPIFWIYHYGSRPVNNGINRAYEYSLDAAQTLPGLQHLASRYDYRSASDNFEFCPVCSTGDSQCARLGNGVLSRSKLGVGTSHRLDHALRGAMDGKATKIADLGGTTAACKGIDVGPENPSGHALSANCYPSQTYAWWNATFPHVGNELANGAPPDISYYAYCNAKHVQEDVDLVIVETLSTEDGPSNDPLQTYEYFETFFRSLLLLKSQPAVVVIGGFSPQWHIDRVREHRMQDIQGHVRELAAYYDIPYISLGAAIQPAYAANHDEVIDHYFQKDLQSPSKEGHGLIADLITHFFQSRICNLMDYGFADEASFDRPVRAVTRSLKNMIFEPGLLQTFAPGVIPPRLALSVPQDGKAFRELKPFCSIAGDLIDPITPHIADGWSAWAPYSWDDPECWQARSPGARIRIDVQISNGRVAVRYEKGPGLGDVMCWVDDNEAGAKLVSGYDPVGRAEPATFFIDEQVSEGAHHVVCEIPPETSNPNKKLTLFKLVGVLTT